jgi:hypothetical protein
MTSLFRHPGNYLRNNSNPIFPESGARWRGNDVFLVNIVPRFDESIRRKIEGFDFSVGKINLPINEFCVTDIIFSELTGLSLNVAIKLSQDFIKKLSYQDRILFREKFQSVFKFD